MSVSIFIMACMDPDIHKAELLLAFLAVKRENEMLLYENKMLKDCIGDVCLNCTRSCKKMSQDARRRMQYYHDNKEEVLSRLCGELRIKPRQISWQVTDHMYDEAYKKMPDS